MDSASTVELLVLPVALAAAVLSGTAGFGGALLLLPVLSAAFGVERALPLLGVAQLASNSARCATGVRSIAWRPVVHYAAGALPMAVLGAVAFTLARPSYARVVVGAVVVALALRSLAAEPWQPTVSAESAYDARTMAIRGALVGLVSAVAGTAGPLGNMAFLSLRLPPIAYVASEACATAAIHLAKLVVFGFGALLGPRDAPYGLVLAVVMVAGTMLARRILERIPKERFERPVRLLMVGAGSGMVLDGVL